MPRFCTVHGKCGAAYICASLPHKFTLWTGHSFYTDVKHHKLGICTAIARNIVIYDRFEEHEVIELDQFEVIVCRMGTMHFISCVC